MNNDLPGSISSDSPTQPDDFELLTKLIACLRPLDDDAKTRLLRSAITFLKLEANFTGSTIVASRPSVAPSINAVAPSSFSERTELSPKQFLNEKRPANDIERVACLAYYLTHFRNLPEFKTLDISKLNTEAAQPKFSNPSVPVDHATRRGLVVTTSGQSKQLGALGEQFVQALPDRDAAKVVLERVRLKRPRKKRTSNSEGEDEQSE